MGEINIGRVILGGVAGGIVADILGYVVDGVMLAPRWTFAMQQLGRTEFSVNQWIVFSVLGLAYGIVAMWLYAASRPRFGAGPRTAVYIALAGWALSALIPNLNWWAAGILPRGLTVFTTAGAVVEWVAGVLVGAALYQEAAKAGASSTAAGA